MFCIDAEVLKSPPVTCPFPLVAEHHTLIKTRDKCRVYKLELEPGQTANVNYAFFHLTIVLKGSSNVAVEIGNGNGHSISWEKELKKGDLEWHSPSLNLKITNKGASKFVQYITEWR